MAPVPAFLGLLFKRSLSTAKVVDPVNNAAQMFKREAAASASSQGEGSIAPQSFNNQGFFALFALLGVAMVAATLWFFFWAKNGGFHWQQNDWEDYKSTVLRRKGPDGRTLSNATKSTKLGGHTIVGSQHHAWQKHKARSVIGYDAKGRKGILGKRGWAKTHSVLYDDEYLTESFATRTVTDEMTELRSEAPEGHGNHHSKRYRDRDVHEYKREKPARVGGLNRVADGSHFDYTNSDRSDILSETVISDASTQPMLNKKKKDDAQDRKRKDKERAERKARDEVAKMERRWKKEAEEAAAALARENQRPAPAVTRNKSAVPSSSRPLSQKPRQQQQQQRPRSRSPSPRKRDFSYTQGPESEILSTAYTGASSRRSASYYDEYLSARQSEGASRHPPSEQHRTRQSSPRKKQSGARSGGYRRGGADSDLE